jgi:hypothetical protein
VSRNHVQPDAKAKLAHSGAGSSFSRGGLKVDERYSGGLRKTAEASRRHA